MPHRLLIVGLRHRDRRANNRRQSVSVMAAEATFCNRCFGNRKGTPPQSGFDFEPDTGTAVEIADCLFENNAGGN